MEANGGGGSLLFRSTKKVRGKELEKKKIQHLCWNKEYHKLSITVLLLNQMWRPEKRIIWHYFYPSPFIFTVLFLILTLSYLPSFPFDVKSCLLRKCYRVGSWETSVDSLVSHIYDFTKCSVCFLCYPMYYSSCWKRTANKTHKNLLSRAYILMRKKRQ